jgi:hypothetical protein
MIAHEALRIIRRAVQNIEIMSGAGVAKSDGCIPL